MPAATAPGFVHLHVHSSYSLLEGALTIARLAELAKKDRQPALALTDTDNMFGALEFSEKMAGAGIQPIVGCALGVDFGDQDNPRRGAGEPVLPRIVLLAAREQGYRSLMRLSLARLSRDRAAPSGRTSSFGLARRRHRGPDRAHRRPGRAARRGDRRRPERARAGALRGVAAAVRRPALYRIAAPRHGGGAAGGAGLDRSRLCARHCRSSPPTSRSSPRARTTRPTTRCCASPRAGCIADAERRQLTAEHRFKTPRRNGGAVRRSAGGAGGDRRDRASAARSARAPGADPAALSPPGSGDGATPDEAPARRATPSCAAPRRAGSSAAARPARARPHASKIIASGSPSSSASSRA